MLKEQWATTNLGFFVVPRRATYIVENYCDYGERDKHKRELRKNGNAIVKIYDIYSRNSMKILYILTLFFDEVFIIKPYSSRPANSEKYILCKSFQHNNTIITNSRENVKLFSFFENVQIFRIS